MRGLPWPGWQQHQPRMAAPGRPERGLHRRAAAPVQGRHAREPGDAAAGGLADRPGHRRPGGVLPEPDTRWAWRPIPRTGRRARRSTCAATRDTGVPACVACHGPAGRGNLAAGYPALRAQQSVYVVKQLNAYADGTRYAGAASAEAGSQQRDDVHPRQAPHARADPRRGLLRAGHALIFQGPHMSRLLALVALLLLCACARQEPAAARPRRRRLRRRPRPRRRPRQRRPARRARSSRRRSRRSPPTAPPRPSIR